MLAVIPQTLPDDEARCELEQTLQCQLKKDAHPSDMQSDTGSRHLVVCVHGMDGNRYDLRTLRLCLEEVFPRMEFLMSTSNEVPLRSL